MNNEPVAWINKDEYHGWLNWDKNTEMPINIPLYTHPVNPYKAITDTKIEPTIVSYTHPAELTDEEIIHIWNTCETDDESEELVMKDFILFARAILRKASEK